MGDCAATTLWRTEVWTTTAGTSFNMTSAAVPSVLVFNPKVGETISAICCGFATTTSSPQVSVELNLMSSYAESGVDVGSTYGLHTPTSANYNEFPLTKTYTSDGSPLAAVIKQTSGQVTILNRGPSVLTMPRWQDSAQRQNIPQAAVKLTSGKYLGGMINIQTIQNISKSSASGTYDEIGNRFSPPFTFKCLGVAINTRFGSTGSKIRSRIYDEGGNVVTGTDIAIADTCIDSTSTQGIIRLYYNTPVTLFAGKIYDVCYRPDNTTSLYIAYLVCMNEEAKNSAFGYGSLVKRLDDAFVSVSTDSFAYITPIIGTSPTPVPYYGGGDG